MPCSNKLAFVLVASGAVLGSCFTAVALLRLVSSSKRKPRTKLEEQQGCLYAFGQTSHVHKSESNESAIVHLEGHSKLDDSTGFTRGHNFLHDEITNEQFTRNIQFFGVDSQMQVHNAFVVVVGLGGVGSHAAAMLARSGIGRLRLVDFDQVSLSSLNRHAVATRADVGLPKAVCLRDHILQIFPECQVDARVQMYDSSSEDDILGGQPDFVLDCIDNIDTKVALLAAAVKRGLKVLSATGAGARADPTRIRISDLSESSNDPLSRSVRHRLRREHGIDSGVPVVFSTEKPKVKLLPFRAPNGDDVDPLDYQVIPGFRVRIIPVMGTIPAVFGQIMASYVITKIASFLVDYEPVVNLDSDLYKILHQRLIEQEEIRFGSATGVEVDLEEVAYVVCELWHGQSARDQKLRSAAKGMWRHVKNLTLTRWNSSKAASPSNLVLFTFQEAEEHESKTIEEIKRDEPEFYEMVCGVLQKAEDTYQCA